MENFRYIIMVNGDIYVMMDGTEKRLLLLVNS